MSNTPDGPYTPGQQVRITGTFSLDGVNTDPGSGNVTLKLLDPNGNESTLTPSDDGAGAWHCDIVTALPAGVWQYRWQGTANVLAAFQGSYYVAPSPF